MSALLLVLRSLIDMALFDSLLCALPPPVILLVSTGPRAMLLDESSLDAMSLALGLTVGPKKVNRSTSHYQMSWIGRFLFAG